MTANKKIAIGMGALLLLSSMIMLSGNVSGFNADLPKRVTTGKEYNDVHIEVSGVYLPSFWGSCTVTLKLLTESGYEITTLNKTTKGITQSSVDFYLDFTIPKDLEEGRFAFNVEVYIVGGYRDYEDMWTIYEDVDTEGYSVYVEENGNGEGIPGFEFAFLVIAIIASIILFNRRIKRNQ